MFPIDAARPVGPPATEFLRPREVVRSAETARRTGEKPSNTEGLLCAFAEKSRCGGCRPHRRYQSSFSQLPGRTSSPNKQKKVPSGISVRQREPTAVFLPPEGCLKFLPLRPLQIAPFHPFRSRPGPQRATPKHAFFPWVDTWAAILWPWLFLAESVHLSFLFMPNTEALSGGGGVLTSRDLTAPPG